jgi:hypothetical protein
LQIMFEPLGVFRNYDIVFSQHETVGNIIFTN